MELSEAILGLVQVSGLLFVVASMLAMGLTLTIPVIVSSISNIKLMVLALVANFVVVPALAYGASEILISDDHPGLQTGLILVGAAAGAPFLPKLVQTAHGTLALGVGLMVVLMLVTIVYLPLVLPLLLPGSVKVDSWQIAKSLIFLMLLPLGIGLFIRARYQQLATSFQPVATQISTLALAFMMIALLVVNFEEIIDTIGTGGIAAALILLVAAFVVGFVVAGGPEEQRSAVGLGTAQRNLSAAIVVAAQNFRDDPEVITMVMVVGVIGLGSLFVAAGELGRRASNRIPALIAEPADSTPTGDQA
jgi:predicted Na+-dependent transporter